MTSTVPGFTDKCSTSPIADCNPFLKEFFTATSDMSIFTEGPVCPSFFRSLIKYSPDPPPTFIIVPSLGASSNFPATNFLNSGYSSYGNAVLL